MKDTFSNRAQSAQKLSRSGTDAHLVVPHAIGQQTPNQLKQIVAAQTAHRWSKIVEFPQNRMAVSSRSLSCRERNHPVK